MTGAFQDMVTFGPGEPTETTLRSAGGSDAFVARYDAGGGLGWVQAIEGLQGIWGRNVAAHPDGQIEEVDRITRGDTVEYEVVIEVDGQEFELLVASDGSILARPLPGYAGR